MLATPLETLLRREGKRFPMPRFLELVALHSPLDSWWDFRSPSRATEGDSAAAAREMAAQLSSGGPACRWSCGTSG